METDKIEMEVESMGKGYLGPIQVELGVKVPVGTLLAMLTDEPETAGLRLRQQRPSEASPHNYRDDRLTIASLRVSTSDLAPPQARPRRQWQLASRSGHQLLRNQSFIFFVVVPPDAFHNV